MVEYRDDPVGFVRGYLGEFPWSKQRDILESARDNRRTAVPSCHDAGKAVSLDTPVSTPDGFRRMELLQVGDHVHGGPGGWGTVTAVSEIQDRPCFRLKLTDGTEIVAADDHTWVVVHASIAMVPGQHRTTLWRCSLQRTTRQLYEAGAGVYVIPGNGHWPHGALAHHIASIEPVESVPTKCIEVDTGTHTYQVGSGCIPTHNSFIAARTAAWWLSVHPPGEAFVVTSAPTFAQVRGILWREINRAHARGRLPGRVNQTEWWIGKELVGFGRKPSDTDTTSFQGIHARYVLILFDEACGIPPDLWVGAETLITNEDARFVAIGNPDDPSSKFAEVCKPGSGWNVIPISAADTPNFTGEDVPLNIRPLLISRTWVEEMKVTWGETSPLYTSKVGGRFPETAVDGLIRPSMVTAAIARSLPPAIGAPFELGVDVARFGADNTVIIKRSESWARVAHKVNGHDTMQVCGAIVKLIRELAEAGEVVTRVKIDDAGVGGGVTDRMNELKRDAQAENDLLQHAQLRKQRLDEQPDPLGDVMIVPVDVGWSPTSPKNKKRFRNLRAELYWGLRERFESGDIDIEADNAMSGQLADMKYEHTSKGQVQIESKQVHKKRRENKSPDEADALMLAFAEVIIPGAGVMAWYEAMSREAAEAEAEAE